MIDLESLMIYKQYVELIDYTLTILMKFPKSEKFAMVVDIKKITYDGINAIIYAQKENNRSKRATILNKLDADLKILKVLIRISKKKKYINSRNYTAWSKKLTNINNLTLGWITSCQRP